MEQIFAWKPEYSVSVKEFDDQHKRLIELINTLHDAMIAGRGRQILQAVLTKLVIYAKTHFTAEERLMRAHQFPAYAAHKAEHDKFTTTILAFEADFQTGKVTLTVPLMQFLKDWLVQHIQKTDKEYAPHFSAKGLK